MLVSCPKCSSKYKLPDEKVRPTGTKVRCPKCQNTFYVHREEASAAVPENTAEAKSEFKSVQAPSPFAQDAGATEAISRSEGSQVKKRVVPPAPTTPPPPIPSNEDFDFMEGAKTMVSPRPSGGASKAAKAKEPSPFKRPPSQDEYRDSEIDEATEFQDKELLERQDISDISSKPENEPKESLRPFGDATFAEIQQAGIPKKQSKKWIGYVAGLIVVTVLGGYALNNLRVHQQVTQNQVTLPPPAIVATVKRNAGWYRDDPAFYQDFLSQMATQPPAEQQKPENRSLLADALISNGMMIGAEDQIISGMGFASGLIAAYPTSVYGFYGLATYAIWKEEVSTLTDLVKRWPQANQNGIEYQLSKAIVDGKSGNIKAGLESLKNVLGQYPDYTRAQVWALLIAVDHWKDAEEVLGAHKVQELVKAFERKKALAKVGSAPAVYVSLEKRLQKKGALLAEAPASKKLQPPKEEAPPPHVAETPPPAPLVPPVSKKEESKPMSVQAKSAPVQLKPNPAQPREQVVDFAAPTKKPMPVSTHKSEPAQKLASKETSKTTKEAKVEPKGKKTLPKADPELIALNKQSSKAKQAAQKLFEEGTQKQKENKIEEAITYFQNALREDPDLADVYKQLGVIYMNKQEKERALRAFKIYLQLKPESEDRQVVQGWISSMQ